MDETSASNPALVGNGHHAESMAQTSSKPASPQLKLEPASEWANSTLSALDSSDHAVAPTSPTLDLPGSYPYSPSSLEPGPTFEEIKDTARQYIHAAGQFVPSHEDVRKLAHGASHRVRGYIPNGVSTRLGPVNPTQEAVPTSPIEESETTPDSGGIFELINRGNRTMMDDAHGESEPQLAPIHKPAQASSEFSGATRSKLLILEPKHSKNNSNSVQNDQASENASMKVLPGSKAESIRLHDSAPTPYSYTAKSAISRSSSNSGVSNNHVDQRTLGSLNNNQGVQTQERPAGVVNHGDYDVVLGPSGEGSVTAPKAGVASGPGPGPGIAGPTILGAGTRETKVDFRSEDGVLATIDDEGSEEEPGPARANVTEEFVGKSESSKSELKDGEKEIGKLKEELSSVKKERELEGAGAKDDEQMKTQVEAVTVGEKMDEKTSTKAGKRSLEEENTRKIENLSPQVSSNMESSVERVGPSAATVEHEGAASTSKSTEPPPSEVKGRQKDASTNEISRTQSPMTSADNPHVGRALSGPNAKKLADPPSTNGAKPSEEQQRSGQKKRSFVQKLKAWSKKLSQNRKGKN